MPVFCTPRFSYSVQKRPYLHAVSVWCTVAVCGYRGVREGVLGWGMGTGWVWEGLYRVPTQLLEERYPDSEAGPVRACRALEWVVWVARTPGAL